MVVDALTDCSRKLTSLLHGATVMPSEAVSLHKWTFLVHNQPREKMCLYAATSTHTACEWHPDKSNCAGHSFTKQQRPALLPDQGGPLLRAWVGAEALSYTQPSSELRLVHSEPHSVAFPCRATAGDFCTCTALQSTLRSGSRLCTQLEDSPTAALLGPAPPQLTARASTTQRGSPECDPPSTLPAPPRPSPPSHSSRTRLSVSQQSCS